MLITYTRMMEKSRIALKHLQTQSTAQRELYKRINMFINVFYISHLIYLYIRIRLAGQ